MGLKVVLASMPGFPLRCTALAPCYALAQGAAAFHGQGHSVSVLDWGSLQSMERFDTPVLRRSLERALSPGNRGPVSSRLKGYRQARNLTALLSHATRDRYHEAAQSILEESPDLVVFHLNNYKEFQAVHILSKLLTHHRPELSIGLMGTFASRYKTHLLRAMAPLRVVLPLPECTQTGNSKDLPYDTARYLDLESSERLQVYPFVLDKGPEALESTLIQVDDLVARLAPPLFVFDASTLSALELESFARAMIQRRYSAHFALRCPVQVLNAENIPLLVLAGCRSVSVAVPTGSQRLLEDFYHAPYCVSQVEATFERIHAADVLSTIELTYPNPMDDYHTAAETLRLLKRTQPTTVEIHLPDVAPGDAWYERAIGYGFHVDPRRYQKWLEGDMAVQEHESSPYLMAGWSQLQIQQATASLTEEIKSYGIHVGIDTLETLVAWQVSGSDDALDLTIQQLSDALAQGDVQSLRSFLALAPAEHAPAWSMGSKYRPFIPALEAVGN